MEEPSSTGPILVLNIRLKSLGSVKFVDPQFGHFISSRVSARILNLQSLQSIKGSVKVSS